MKNISLVLFILSGVLMSGCRIYSTYERPGNLPVDSLYRDVGGAFFCAGAPPPRGGQAGAAGV